jgi:hypothetical protein
MPDSAILDIKVHSVIFFTPVGILQGRYGLLFDFNSNMESVEVPKSDIGRWRIGNLFPNALNLSRTRFLEFGDSTNLSRYKIDSIKIDRVDTSAVYFATKMSGSDKNCPTKLVFLIKHESNQEAFFWTPPGLSGPIEKQAYFGMDKH